MLNIKNPDLKTVIKVQKLFDTFFFIENDSPEYFIGTAFSRKYLST